MTNIVTCVGSDEYKLIFTTDIKEDYDIMEKVARAILDVRNAEQAEFEKAFANAVIEIISNDNNGI